MAIGQRQARRAARRLSVDWWAVITSLVLTALVLLGVIHDVSW